MNSPISYPLLRSFSLGFVLSLQSLVAVQAQVAPPHNRVLHLDDDGDYVQLPGDLFLDFEAATVEAWVKWEDFSYYSQWFAFGSGS